MLLASTARAATLLDPTPAENDFFGSAVTLAGGNLLVGARFDDTAASDAGAAYLLDAATGALLTTLLEPAPAASDQFGAAVAAVRSDLLVGAPHFNSGDAHAAAGAITVVGAPFDDTTKPNAGSAYVFDAATGALLHTLQAPHPREGDLFGSAVAASDTMILVGAPFDDTVAANAGAAHLFDASTGALLHTFLNPRANPDGRFGSAVAIAGSAVLIGAPFDDTGAADAGIAYLFDAASGVVLATFENPTPAPGDQFGASLAADGNLVVVGSWLDDTAAPNAGAVYVFTDQVFPSSS